MKRLVLVRHGKAEKELINDFSRALVEKGVQDSIARGELIANQLPDRIFTSPALRALSTATLLAKSAQYPLQRLVINPDLYVFDGASLLKELKSLPSIYNHLVVVGHNNALFEAAYELGAELPKFHTGGLLQLVFDCENWIEIGRSNLEKSDYVH